MRSLLQRVEALVAEGKPGRVKRRRFLELLGAAAAGAIALPYVPQKLYFVGGWPDSIESQAWAEVATYGGLTAEQREFYSRVLIKRLLPNLPLERFVYNPRRVVNTGTNIQFRRWGELALPTEGTEVTEILSQYGSWSVLS